MGDQTRKRWNRLSLVIMGVGVAALIASGVLTVLTITGNVGDDGNSVPETVTGFQVSYTPAPPPTDAPTPEPASDAPIARIAIPKFGVDAPIVVRGVDANGVMETPDGPEEVAWYDFTARPGVNQANAQDGQKCCNSVFSAHVDYYNYGPAVFYDLAQLQAEDVIEVTLDDGTVYRYAVHKKDQVYASTADVNAIVGNTEDEVITLITCGGTFDSSVGQYDQRVIVRAHRIYDEAPPAGDGVPAEAAGQ